MHLPNCVAAQLVIIRGISGTPLIVSTWKGPCHTNRLALLRGAVDGQNIEVAIHYSGLLCPAIQAFNRTEAPPIVELAALGMFNVHTDLRNGRLCRGFQSSDGTRTQGNTGGLNAAWQHSAANQQRTKTGGP